MRPDKAFQVALRSRVVRRGPFNLVARIVRFSPDLGSTFVGRARSNANSRRFEKHLEAFSVRLAIRSSAFFLGIAFFPPPVLRG